MAEIPRPTDVKPVTSFDDMQLSCNLQEGSGTTQEGGPGPLLRGIYSYGIEHPSAIQQRFIVPFIHGKNDIIAQACPGTGKTVAFVISTLQRLDFGRRDFQALILSSTRELALQTQAVVSRIGEYMCKTEGNKWCPSPREVPAHMEGGTRVCRQNLDASSLDQWFVSGTGCPLCRQNSTFVQNDELMALIGDYELSLNNFCHTFVDRTRVQLDIRKIAKNGLLVAVGTPDRVYDVIKSEGLPMANVKILVLDDADDMLSKGFSEKIYEVFRCVPRGVQVALFTTTISEDVLSLTTKITIDPIRILVKKEMLLSGTKQYYVAVEEEYKLETLWDIYDSVCIAQSIIFCNSPDTVDWLSEELNKRNHTVSFIHSDITEDEREEAIARFKGGSTRVLITTDLLAPGLDLYHVSMVINFDVPANREDYLHRIGRSGRHGRKGVAINFVTARHAQLMKDIEAHYHTKIDELPMDWAAMF